MLPENLTIEHVAKVMKRTPEKLEESAENPRIAFCKPRLRPVGGKMRLITVPRKGWGVSHAWLGNFLRKEFPLHPAAHGSVPSKSPFTAAACHLGWRHLLCRDVKDAFPSIKADRFYLEMLALGFNSNVATLLTKILLPDGYLPQGGPASNAAVDLFFYRVDCDIAEEMSRYHARYTRFTDGLDGSFVDANSERAVSDIFHRQLARLGLNINPKKLDKQGWNPANTERVICGVRVNSPKGTQLPRAVLKKIIAECESLHRGSCSVAPHTIVGLAQRRRSIQGWLNQASQADLAPTGDLQRRLHLVDRNVCEALRKVRIYPNRAWYIKSQDWDTSVQLASKWSERRKLDRALLDS